MMPLNRILLAFRPRSVSLYWTARADFHSALLQKNLTWNSVNSSALPLAPMLTTGDVYGNCDAARKKGFNMISTRPFVTQSLSDSKRQNRQSTDDKSSLHSLENPNPEDQVKSKKSSAGPRKRLKTVQGSFQHADEKTEGELKRAKQKAAPPLESSATKTAWDLVCNLRSKAAEKERTEKAANSSETPEAARPGKPVLPNRFSDGSRDYRHVVPDWDRMTSGDVVSMLKKRIIYDKDGVVAIDKPYGLPVHGGPSVHHSVGKYLPDLAAELDKTGELKTLHLVNRIDKETTGVLLLARTVKMAGHLNDMFVKRSVKKYYWAITKSIPDPLKGIIQIPIGDSDTTGKYRRVLRPMRTPASALVMTKGAKLGGKIATTAYSVLGTSGDCALVEVNPTSGLKHQIRVHLAHGINCPVLGDHKYSHFTKLAPQRLPLSMLKRLHLRQSKVRTLPMHLHARAIVLPEFMGGENIRIEAELPTFFRHSLTNLRLKERVFE